MHYSDSGRRVVRFFPQLDSGALLQMASRRTSAHRTVSTSTSGSSGWRSTDPGFREQLWDCVFEGLSGVEVERIESLFRECRGRQGSFVFPDPTENALAWSTDLRRDVWNRDPFLAISAGIDDPLGDQAAFRAGNASGGHQGLKQSVSLPGSYALSFSLWLRGTGVYELFLLGAERLTVSANASSMWQRVEVNGRPGGTGGTIEAGLLLWPGTAVDVFGPQLTVGGLSRYRPSGIHGGVYGESRFADDELAVTQTDSDQFRMRVRLNLR
jgi:hypothetical protein